MSRSDLEEKSVKKSIKVEIDISLSEEETMIDEWWLALPPPKITHKAKSRKELGIRRGKTIKLSEQKIIIAYMIINKNIREATSRKTFEKMHNNGYMTHRTIESLHNHTRKHIIPKIDKFDLPEKIKRQFRNTL